MKIYHGTNSEFNSFKLPEEVVDHEYYGPALYFTTSYDVAKYYGSRVIEMEIDDSLIAKVIDANSKGIKYVSNELKDAINIGGVIAVENVFDSELSGAQCEHLSIYEKSDEYKYFNNYIISMHGLSKKKANEIKDKLSAIGVNSFVSKEFMGKTYHLFDFGKITDEQAKAVHEAGIPIKKVMCRTPSTATTVVFAGDKGLKILNSRR